MLKNPIYSLDSLPHMGMHQLNFPQFTGFKQKNHKLQKIYAMHAHIW